MDDTQPARQSISGGEASSFIEFDFGDDISLDFPRNGITLTPMRRTSRLLSPYDVLEQGSDPGTATPQLHHGGLRDVPPEDPLVGNARKKSEGGGARALRRKRFFRDWWFWEILGALLSICCMVAVVILGLYLDGLSLSDWNFVMAPSTVISTSVTVAKTSMLLPVAEGLSQLKWVYFWVNKRPLSELEAFDDASRGPWGSIMFFWKIKPASLLAWCGAFLTVAALAMGPFAQQVISIQIRTIPRAGADASILVTNISESLYYGRDPFSPWISSGQFRADPKLQFAEYGGLFDLGHPFEYNCASGNCTWPDTYSLGICSTCFDVTGKPEVEMTGFSINLTVDGSSIPIWKVSGLTNYAIIAGNTSTSSSDSMSSWDIDSGIINFTIAQSKLPNGGLPLNDALGMKDIIGSYWKIVECRITWCAKCYTNFRVVNGAVENLEVREIPLQLETYYRNPGDFKSSTNLWAATPSGKWNHTDSMPPFHTNIFTISKSDFDALRLSLRKLFSFSAWRYSSELSAVDVALLYPANVSAVVAGMADSLTNFLRTRNTTAAHGTVWDQDTYISIQWAWFTLPIALVLFSTAFLIITSLINAKHKAPLWKSALLPYLFHGPGGDWWNDDERLELREGLFEQKYDMEDRAKGIAARLRRTGEGETRFVRD